MGSVVGKVFRGIGKVWGEAIGAVAGQGAEDAVNGLFGGWADLFDPITKIKQRRLRDFDVSSGDAFDPLDMPSGPTSRVRGIVTYIGPIKAQKVETSSGKGGGSTEQQSYIYRADVAVDFCEAPDGGLVEITSIWADGQFVYGQNPDQDETSDQLSCVKVVAKNKTFLDITSTATGPNLKKFKPSGAVVQMSGWATGGNNVDAEVVSTKKNKSTNVTTMRLRIAPADASGVANEAAGATVTLLQENVKSNLNELADVTIYLGTDSQLVDPALETNEGAGNTSAARGRGRIVISQMALNRWGNRVPMSWEAVVKADSSLTLAQAVARLCAQAGLSAGQYDVTGLSGTVLGFVQRAGDAPEDALVALMLAYDVLAREVSGQIVFFHRSAAPHVTVTADELGAHAADEAPQRELRLTRSPELSLPSDVSVSYLDPTKDLQQSDARQQAASPTRQRSESFNIPVVLNPEDARAIAKRLYWLPAASRHTVSFNLPPSRQDVVPGDVIDVTAHGEAWQLLVQRVDAGANGVLAVQAIADNTGVVSTAAVAGADDDSDSLQVPPPCSLEAMDLPAISEAHVLLPGIYLPVALYDTEQPWQGATVFESADDGVTYVPAALANVESVMGYVSTGTLFETATPMVWDLGSSISVTIWNGELESVSELDALNWRNMAAVQTDSGWEVIIFRNATLTATSALGHKTYTLDTFLRGVRGTEEQIDNQQANAAFALLDPAQFAQYLIADQGKARRFKAVPNGGASSDFDDYEEATIGLRTLQPFAPAESSSPPYASASSPVDLTFVWARRTRAFVDEFAVVPQMPLAEEQDIYEVDVLLDGVVVRTEEVTGTGDGTATWTYDTADQATDGIALSTTLIVQVFQISTSVGRGIPLSFVYVLT